MKAQKNKGKINKIIFQFLMDFKFDLVDKLFISYHL